MYIATILSSVYFDFTKSNYKIVEFGNNDRFLGKNDKIKKHRKIDAF